MPFDGLSIVADNIVRTDWNDTAFAALFETERRLTADAEQRDEREAKLKQQRAAELRLAWETKLRLRQHAKLQAARERYANAKLPTQYIPIPADASRKFSKAREAIEVLDLLEDLFNDGENWCQGAYHDGWGNYCILGALRHIRSRRGSGDHAAQYLSKAIVQFQGRKGAIIEFNDTRSDYAEIRIVISLARELARRVVEKCSAQSEFALYAPRCATAPDTSNTPAVTR